MTSINYSKWDKIDVSDSEESDGDAYTPTVTTLGSDSSVTIGPTGVSLGSSSSSSSSSAAAASFDKQTTKSTECSEDVLWMRNGCKTELYYWSQDKIEVVLRVKVNSDIKASTITIIFGGDKQLSIRTARTIILSSKLRYDVETNNIESGDAIFDWEIKTYRVHNDTVRLLEIILRKKCPIPGAVMWWENVFEGDEEIDVTMISDRKLSVNSISNDNDSKSTTRFSEAWRLAHEEFQEKMKNKGDHAISID